MSWQNIHSTWEYDQERTGRFQAEKNLNDRSNQLKKLRETLADIVESFSEHPEIQNSIINVVEGNGHDKHLIKRLKGKVKA